MSTIAIVAISHATREFDKQYRYRIPENLSGRVVPGIRVIVPFGKANKDTEAYVLHLSDESSLNTLKDIKKIIDESPLLSISMLELANWMKTRYICTCSDSIKTMLPPGIGVQSFKTVKLLKQDSQLKSGYKKILDALKEQGGEYDLQELKSYLGLRNFYSQIDELVSQGLIEIYEEYIAKVKEKSIRVAYLAMPKEEVIDDIEGNRIKKIQQIRILELLLDNEYISVADIVRFSGVSAGVLDTLRKYGYINYKEIEILRDPYKNREFARTKPLEPTMEQKQVLEFIKNQIHHEEFGETLLHGVTGSGKTEVYLQLIEDCISKGKQAIVLVPEISLTPQMVARFKGRFGEEVAVLHSRLSLGERYDQWRIIKDGGIKVVVGARSAVFAPLKKLGLIIIDEEHESTYKSEITPKYHARDVARKRCELEKAVLLLGSATPSVETFFRAENKEIKYTTMKERANSMVMPKVEVVDMRKELESGNRSIFSSRLSDEIIKNREANQQSILFLNKRGYASFILCRSCGYVLKCSNCSITMTFHAYDKRLICHYCGYTVKNPDKCPKCSSTHIRSFGAGTQKVEEEIKKKFDGCSVIRMDMDTTSYKNSHEEILHKFREENIHVLVGTQMIAKGHDFPKVTLVGVLAADSLLNTGDFRATERTFQLITQVAGRAGRGELPGRVVVQSYNTEDFSIQCACKHDYESFYRQEIKLREKLNYPPFTNIASIVLSGTNDRAVFEEAKLVRKSIKEQLDGQKSSVLGPSRSPLVKINNRYRWRIIIKCESLRRLVHALSILSDRFYRKNNKKSIDMSMDINPVSML